MSIEAMKIEGPLHVVCQCDKCKEQAQKQEQKVDWEKLYRLEVKKKEALAAKYERDIKPLTRIVPMAQKPEGYQEPVAWMFQHEETRRMNYVSNDGMNTPELFLKMNRRYVFVCALYTFPPQRQPLTDEEIRKAKHHMVEGAYHYSFQQGVRYAEAAHGIKGEA